MDELYAVHLSNLLSTLPRVPPELALSNVKGSDIEIRGGGTSDAWKGLQGDRVVVLKAMRYFERAQTEASRRVVEASAVTAELLTTD